MKHVKIDDEAGVLEFAAFVKDLAEKNPVSHASYSGTPEMAEENAIALIKRNPKALDAGYNYAVYYQDRIFALVFSKEMRASRWHLSLSEAQQFMGGCRIGDEHANLFAKAFLGEDYQEINEGVLGYVRHFVKAFDGPNQQ